MVLFTQSVKKIKGATHKNAGIDGTCKRSLNCIWNIGAMWLIGTTEENR